MRTLVFIFIHIDKRVLSAIKNENVQYNTLCFDKFNSCLIFKGLTQN